MNIDRYLQIVQICINASPVAACKGNYGPEDSSSIHSFGKIANPAN